MFGGRKVKSGRPLELERIVEEKKRSGWRCRLSLAEDEASDFPTEKLGRPCRRSFLRKGTVSAERMRRPGKNRKTVPLKTPE